MAHDLMLSFVAIFVALDIVGTLPLYLSMTRSLSSVEKGRIVNRSMVVAFVTAVAFIFMGQALFRMLGITLGDFKIAGGIILLLVSLADLLGGPSASHSGTSGSTGIVPLAVPLITGPGVLTTLILQTGTVGYVVTLIALVANYLLGWILLRSSERINRVIGEDGMVVISKIAALLLAAIAVAMIRGGVTDVIPALVSASR